MYKDRYLVIIGGETELYQIEMARDGKSTFAMKVKSESFAVQKKKENEGFQIQIDSDNSVTDFCSN